MRELVLSIALHAALGIALAALVLAVGLGCLPRRCELRDAYPFGLLAVVAAATAVLLSPWLVPLAAALVLVPLALAARRLAGLAAAMRPSFAAVIWAFPAIAGLPVALGLLLHGPTESLDSRAYGDMLYYVNKIVSGAQTLAPFRDLLAEGQTIIYAEGAPSFVGAVLVHLPGFDPVLAQTSTMPAFLLVSVAFGLGIERPRRAGNFPGGPLGLVAIGLVAVSMVAYPTWITESPPVALAVPLAFSIHRLGTAAMPLGWLAALAGVVALDLFLTKVLAILPLGIVVLFALARRVRGRPDARRIALSAGAGLAAAAAVLIALLFSTAAWYTRLLELEFVPADAARGLWSQLDTRDTHAAAPGVAIAGQALLVVALVRAQAFAVAAALAVAVVASWFIGGQVGSFDVAIGTAILLAALHFWAHPDALRQQRWLVLAAGLVLTLSSWFREVAHVHAGFVLVTLLAASLVTALLASSLVARRYVLAALVAAAAGVFAAIADNGFRLVRFDPVLTSEDYRVWEQVSAVVPRDGLVFTSMTGAAVDGRQGWNNYPSIAGRQLYLAGWYDGRLVSQPDELRRRLSLNRRVLSGELSPARLDLSRRFASYFAVLWAAEAPPPSFERLYANRLLALYRIPA